MSPFSGGFWAPSVTGSIKLPEVEAAKGWLRERLLGGARAGDQRRVRLSIVSLSRGRGQQFALLFVRIIWAAHDLQVAG